MPSLPSIEDILKTTTLTVVMRDPQLQKRNKHARAQLRSIPFFVELGIDTVVHADVYDNDFKLIDYTHYSSGDVVDSVNDIEFPLVHITTQEGVEEYGEEELVRALLQRATEERERYILVTDTTSPRLPTYIQKPGRSIVDDYDVAVKDYKKLSADYLGDYVDSALSAVSDTQSPLSPGLRVPQTARRTRRHSREHLRLHACTRRESRLGTALLLHRARSRECP
nr:hypothetical protein [Haloferax sp. BAB-2207]